MTNVENLMTAIVQVRSLLGAINVKEGDIKDSIYHYDFDTDRAAKYLKDKHDKASKPKTKPTVPKLISPVAQRPQGMYKCV